MKKSWIASSGAPSGMGMVRGFIRSATGVAPAAATTATTELVSWAEKTEVTPDFVRDKYLRVTRLCRLYLGGGTLTDAQSRALYDRLDAVSEALSGELFTDANGLMNQAIDFVRTLPPPFRPQPVPAE